MRLVEFIIEKFPHIGAGV